MIEMITETFDRLVVGALEGKGSQLYDLRESLITVAKYKAN